MTRFTAALMSLCAIMLLAVSAAPLNVQATGVFSDVCDTSTQDATVCVEANDFQSVPSNSIYGPSGILTRVARFISIIVGIAAVIMIIVGGIKYTASGGDANQASSAKKTIIFAIVGLVIAILAQAIIGLVISKVV